MHADCQIAAERAVKRTKEVLAVRSSIGLIIPSARTTHAVYLRGLPRHHHHHFI